MVKSKSNFSVTFAAILAAVACCALSAPTFAGGGAGKADASRLSPDVPRKVYTNDDLGWPSARTAAASEVSPTKPSVAMETVARVSLEPQQDARWYARQIAALDDELADLSSRAEPLRQFRFTGAGMPTGLVLGAPCEGITTDNLIAQLDLRRAQITQRLDELDDMARRNGVRRDAIAEAGALERTPPALTAEEQQTALANAYRERSEELARTRAVVSGMQDEMDAQRMSLLRAAPGWGGNMTTNLLQRFDRRASTLEGQMRDIEDDARQAGAQPGLLR